jgi:hypothetical protein
MRELNFLKIKKINFYKIGQKMTSTSFNPASYSARLNEIDSALQNGDKWLNVGMELVDKENGFVRFIKVLVLPFARIFNQDPFNQIRADAVAVSLTSEFLKHQGQLNLEDKKRFFNILTHLDTKTKSKYLQLQAILLPNVKSSFGVNSSLPPQKKIDVVVINDDTKSLTTSPRRPLDHIHPMIPTPPPQPPKIPQPPKKTMTSPKKKTEKKNPPGPFGNLDKDLLKDVFNKNSMVNEKDQSVIITIFNTNKNIGLGKLAQQIDAFLDSLGMTNDSDNEIIISDDDLLMGVESHPILGRFIDEYKTLPKSAREDWIEKTVDYLDKILMPQLKLVKGKGAAGKKEGIQFIHDHSAQIEQMKKLEEFEKVKIEQEQLKKYIQVDPESYKGIVKMNKWKLHVANYELTAESYQEAYKRVFTWIDTIHNLETIKKIKANETLTPAIITDGDEEMMRIAEYNQLTKVKSGWGNGH